MKDVLITGGIGKIGFNLVEKLLDSNYSITVLDLESKDSIKKTFKIKDKIKIVYGDIEDANLVRDLVKRNDIIIDYAGIMPPLADLNEEIANSTNFLGTKNIVDAINEVNPSCVLIYMSFISIYGKTDKAVRRLSVDSESTYPDDYYSVSLIRSEDYIRSNLKKYAIFRMPIVLTRKNYFINHMKLDRSVDFMTKEDLNDIIISVMKSRKIHGKTYNLSGFQANTSTVVKKLYDATGNLRILNRNIYYGKYDDANAIEDVIEVKHTSLDTFYKNLKKETSPIKRGFRKFINFPKYLIFKRSIKK